LRQLTGGTQRRLLIGGLAAAMLIAPAQAAGSTASVSGRTLFVKAAPGEQNVIQVGFDQIGGDPVFVVSDVPGPNAGNGCFDFAQTAICSASGVRRIKIEARDGSDVALIDDQVPRTRTRIFAGSGNDRIRGSRGNDWIEGDTGADSIEGNAGRDTVSYKDRTLPVLVKLGRTGVSGNAEDGPTGARDSIANDVENIRGGGGADRLFGTGFANVLVGAQGNDILRGRRGRDRLRGGLHNDVLGGGAGNDLLKGNLGADFLRGGAGRDRERGGNGSDRVRGGTGSDRLKGGAGADHMNGLPGNEKIHGGPGTDLLLGQQGIDRIFAADGNRELKISCGPGANKLEFAERDSRDPRARSC
jgi:Ca2+-binding RTX toxin-like protein